MTVCVCACTLFLFVPRLPFNLLWHDMRFQFQWSESRLSVTQLPLILYVTFATCQPDCVISNETTKFVVTTGMTTYPLPPYISSVQFSRDFSGGVTMNWRTEEESALCTAAIQERCNATDAKLSDIRCYMEGPSSWANWWLTPFMDSNFAALHLDSESQLLVMINDRGSLALYKLSDAL
eukprot:Gregarina_sp_Poly_1__4822@NODE_256_length_10541_cov_633_466679_g223_i0_p6_GENE_NODE_256_length_10541_cov_633_466679_g223_i0NODE_256_length_10541_cov_633_466679_g223_i0_p6_ORF_typecomplete_len179_score14_49DUF3172/PF11371_8/0_17_NODE_256_length_10541_cov_633_466679_g223_i0956010096